MRVIVNGDALDVPEEATIATVVQMTGATPSAKGLAVAVNAEVVPRSAWDEKRLAAEDRVEVLRAIGGG